jgi:DNA recombination-dependent growth factor C
MVRVDLERKIETLREELEYNRKVHGEEMEDFKEQIASQVMDYKFQKMKNHIFFIKF